MALDGMLWGDHTMRHESLTGDRCLLFTYRAVPDRSQAHVYGADITEHKRAEQTLLQQTEELAIGEEKEPPGTRNPRHPGPGVYCHNLATKRRSAARGRRR